MVMRLRVEYAYDPESHNWSFRVPSLGGGAETREEAEKRVVAAVVFTLEGEEDGSTPAHLQVQYVDVEIAAR